MLKQYNKIIYLKQINRKIIQMWPPSQKGSKAVVDHDTPKKVKSPT